MKYHEIPQAARFFCVKRAPQPSMNAILASANARKMSQRMFKPPDLQEHLYRNTDQQMFCLLGTLEHMISNLAYFCPSFVRSLAVAVAAPSHEQDTWKHPN